MFAMSQLLCDQSQGYVRAGLRPHLGSDKSPSTSLLIPDADLDPGCRDMVEADLGFRWTVGGGSVGPDTPVHHKRMNHEGNYAVLISYVRVHV